MDVREKLVELLDNAIIDSDDNYGFVNHKQKNQPCFSTAESFVVNLLFISLA